MSSFTVGFSSASLTLSPGSGATRDVNIVRTNFPASISLTLTGAPTGLTWAFSPASTTGSSILTLTTVASLVPGTYTLTLHASSTGVADQTATLTLSVVAAGTGAITVDFSSCAAVERPVWFAAQDGSGAWTRVAGSNNAYAFSMVQSKGGIAFATVNDSSIVTVEYFAETDLHSGTADYVVRLDRCPFRAARTINGTAAGLLAGDVANLSFGSAPALVGGNSAFQMTNIAAGTMDLVGYLIRAGGPSVGDRMLLQRSLTTPDGGSLGTVDFQGAGSFAPASATMTVSGLAANETLKHGMFYYTAGGTDVCEVSKLYDGIPAAGNVFTAFGAPAANQLPTDWHAAAVFTALNNNSFRSLHEYFVTMGARTLVLGAAMPAPAVSVLAGAYKRLDATVIMPADYQSRTSLRYRDPLGTHSSVIVTATQSWIGSSSVDLSLPDFSAVTGWTSGWAPASGTSVDWQLIGSNATDPPHCSLGSKYISAIRTGSL